jgi:hypothetical protein
MASIIRIKRSSTSGNPGTLGAGEVAYSALTGTQSNGGDRLYIGFGTETAGDAANHFVIGGKYFTDMLDHVHGTNTADSALITDASGKLDVLKTTNLQLGGSGVTNVIQSTDTNGNILLDPNGTGYVQIVGTNALVIPVGTTAQQGPSVQGGVRYNTDNSAFEGYNGTSWTSLGGVRSVDGLTFIRAESSSGASNDELEFYAAAADNTTATKYAGLNRTRLAVLPTTTSSSTTTGALTVAGGTGIAENLWVGGTTNLAGALTYGGVTLSNAVTGTGNMVLSASPTFTGTVVAPNANGISVGTPALGTLTGAATFTTSTTVTDGIATLNQILSKLVPAQPNNFPNGQTLTINSVANYRIAVAQGSQTTNGNSGVAVAAGSTVSTLRASTFQTNTFSTMGPADTGTISVYRNTSLATSHVMTVGNTTATVVTGTVTATTNASATVTLTSTAGVIQAGHKFLASGTGFGGLASGSYYYVSSISGTQAVLKTYNNSTGVIGSDFSASSTATGTVTFTAQGDAGTYTNSNTSLVLANNLAFPTGTPGFWETIDTYASGTSVPAGWNTVQIQHSGASNTNTASWYYDSSAPGTAVATPVSITAPASPTYKYSSTIPHFDGGSANAWTLSTNVGKLSGDMYPTSDTFFTGTAGGAFAAPASVTYSGASISTPLSANYLSASTVAVSTTSQVITGFGSSSTGPSVTVQNSYAQGTGVFTSTLAGTVLYKSTTVGTASILDEGSIYFASAVGGATTAGYRVPNPGSADTPAFTAGQTAFNSQNGTIQTYDAKIVGNVLKYDVTNYSTGYLPAGPNFSGHGANQYFTFVFIRTGVSKFNIAYTAGTGGIAGMWVAMPGSGGTSGTTSTLNKWLSLAIDNSLADGAALGGNINLAGTGAQSVNASFGTLSSTNATNNEIWVRIKLTSGQSISALALGASTV